jgi:hypothetical protein
MRAFNIGDYIEVRSGKLCLVYTDIDDSLFAVKYITSDGEVMTGRLYVFNYKRHATVNEITALKLMGLV